MRRPVGICALLMLTLLVLGPLPAAAQAEEEGDAGEDLDPTGSILGADSALPRPVSEDFSTVGLRLDLIATPGGGSFFEAYPLLFGRARELDVVVMPGLGGRFRLTDRLRATLFGSWASTGFSDVYDAFRFPSDTTQFPSDTLLPAAQVIEEMSLDGLILLAGVEYSPVVSQFSSYVGLSGGLGVIRTEWYSTTRVFGNIAYERPRINVESTRPYPAIRLYSGVDLRFDFAEANRSIVRGVYVEASWLWLPVSEAFFGPIGRTSQNLPFLPSEENSTLNLGGFAIGIGLNLQLVPDSLDE